MFIEFTNKLFHWRGPAPFFFVAVPENHSAAIKSISKMITYGWGVIPVQVRIGDTEFKTSLFPKDDKYLVPVKAVVRKAEALEEGDSMEITLEIKV